MTNSHKKLGDSNTLLIVPEQLGAVGNLLQFLAFLTVTVGWRGSCFRFPIVLVLRLIPRALRMSSALADRLDGRWRSWIRGDGDGLRLALADTGRWRTRPGWRYSVCVGA